MVGFTQEQQLDLDQASKLKLSRDPPDAVDPRLVDLSFVDSFLDFDSIENWYQGVANLDMAEVVKSKPPVDSVKSEVPEIVSNAIVEELGKVSLLGGSEESSVVVGVDSGNGVSEGVEIKIEGEDGVESKMESGSGSESSDSESESSSSSSSSSSVDEEEKEDEDSESDDVEEVKEGERNVAMEKEDVELEEGEISCEEGEEAAEVAWSDVDIFGEEDEEEEEEVVKGPIRSKNELEVLPPVPPVNVTLEPHHEMLPVGVVLSIVDTKVIVEGVEKHSPLNEGSILWITESRSPLGLVDEIFGPVVSPYYMVRYNTDSEIPAGIEVGTAISFVQEFADHVLNNKDLYRKGYDASGENDEEVSAEEFSDDEKEAEYRRMQKLSKRGMRDQSAGSKRGKKKPGQFNSGQPSPQKTPFNKPHQNRPSSHGYSPSLSSVSEGSVSWGGSVPPFSGTTQATGMHALPNGVWNNGMPVQPPRMPFPNAYPNNNMAFFPQFPQQMSIPGGMPFHQQQANALAGPMGAPGIMSQHGFHQPAFGIGFQGQPIPGQQLLNSFPGAMFNQNAFGMVQQGQAGLNHNPFGIGQHGQPGFNPNTFAMGQQGQHGFHQNPFVIGQQGQPGFNPNAFAMGQQGPTGSNENTPGGGQGPPANAISEQNMPQPANPVGGDVNAPQQFNRSTSGGSRGGRGRGRGRGGRQFGRGRGRGSR